MNKKILLVSLTALASLTLVSCGDTAPKSGAISSNKLLASTTLSGAKFFGQNSSVSVVKTAQGNAAVLLGNSSGFSKEQKDLAVQNFEYVSNIVASQEEKVDVNLDDYKNTALKDLTALKTLFQDESLDLAKLKTDYIAYFVTSTDIQGKKEAFLYLYKDKTTVENAEATVEGEAASSSATEEASSSSEQTTPTEETKSEEASTPASSTESSAASSEEQEASSQKAEEKQLDNKEEAKGDKDKANKKENDKNKEKENKGSKEHKNKQNIRKDYGDKETYHLEGAALLLTKDNAVNKIFDFNLKNEEKKKKEEVETESTMVLTEVTKEGVKTTNVLTIKQETEVETEEGQTEKEVVYTYTYKENSVKVKEVEISFEEEHDLKEWSVSQKEEGKKTKYAFEEFKKGDKKYVKATIKDKTKATDNFYYDSEKSSYVWDSDAVVTAPTPATPSTESKDTESNKESE